MMLPFASATEEQRDELVNAVEQNRLPQIEENFAVLGSCKVQASRSCSAPKLERLRVVCCSPGDPAATSRSEPDRTPLGMASDGEILAWLYKSFRGSGFKGAGPFSSRAGFASIQHPKRPESRLDKPFV